MYLLHKNVNPIWVYSVKKILDSNQELYVFLYARDKVIKAELVLEDNFFLFLEKANYIYYFANGTIDQNLKESNFKIYLWENKIVAIHNRHILKSVK